MFNRRDALDACLRVLVGLSLLFTSMAGSTQISATLSGRVSDSSGAALSRVRVEAINERTGQQVAATTSEDGSFTISVAPGRYTVTITAVGFKKATLEHLAVNLAATQPLNVVLRVGTTEATAPTAPRHPPAAPRHPPAAPPHPPKEGNASSGLMTGREFLIANEKEAVGYGLYSYLLFVAAPDTEAGKSRDLALIRAFLQMLSDVSDLEAAGASKSDLNVTYLLLTERPTQTQELPPADWVLSHYNFARAEVLIHKLQKAYVNGPYVISTLVPLSIQSQPPDQFLVQDMSNVPSEVAGLWEQEFERRAAQKDFWAPATRDQAILQLRTFVANAAYAFSDVNVALSTFKSSVAEWISWK